MASLVCIWRGPGMFSHKTKNLSVLLILLIIKIKLLHPLSVKLEK